MFTYSRIVLLNHGERLAVRIAISYTGEYHRHERADKPPAPAAAGIPAP